MKNLFIYTIGTVAKYLGYFLEYIGDIINHTLDNIEDFLQWCDDHLD